MKYYTVKATLSVIFFITVSCKKTQTDHITADKNQQVVRIAKLDIEKEHLDEYLVILKEEAKASVNIEPGVICIYPMYQKENPTQIQLLEIYSSQEAYESHLKTPHFEKYKTSTMHMVKSLELIDMEAVDQQTMAMIFRKHH